MLSPDTTDEAYRVQVSVWRSMTGEERLLSAIEMSEEVFDIARAGIRHRHPEYSADDVEWAVRRMRIGDDELFNEAWPTAPLLAP